MSLGTLYAPLMLILLIFAIVGDNRRFTILWLSGGLTDGELIVLRTFLFVNA